MDTQRFFDPGANNRLVIKYPWGSRSYYPGLLHGKFSQPLCTANWTVESLEGKKDITEQIHITGSVIRYVDLNETMQGKLPLSGYYSHIHHVDVAAEGR